MTIDNKFPTDAQRKASYDVKFFRSIKDHSQRSAEQTVPILFDLVKPTSVIDVGCGTGAWLRAFCDVGVTRIMGIDGDYVQRDELLIPVECFAARKLQEPWEIGGSFDLAVSLEVGEHLPHSSSKQFVQTLCRLAPIVAFSAAVPGQGGVHHINEQWPSYWAERFMDCGFVAVDAIRKRIWTNEQIAWYYRQNLVLYVEAKRIKDFAGFDHEYMSQESGPLPLVHPGMYEGLRFATRPENIPVMAAIKILAGSCRAAIARRLGRRSR